MIIKTIKRLDGIVDVKNSWVLGNNAQEECLASLGDIIPKQQILAEPYARNTAACIGWGAMQVSQNDPDAVLVILPADAWIEDEASFQDCIKQGIDLATSSNVVVTLGIKPRSAHTGYGYIKVVQSDEYPFSVESFTEKPNKQTAEDYFKDSKYFWNAGIFIAKSFFSIIFISRLYA